MADDKRGLASASKATRQRVAREGGKASGESRGNKGGQSERGDDTGGRRSDEDDNE